MCPESQAGVRKKEATHEVSSPPCAAAGKPGRFCARPGADSSARAHDIDAQSKRACRAGTSDRHSDSRRTGLRICPRRRDQRQSPGLAKFLHAANHDRAGRHCVAEPDSPDKGRRQNHRPGDGFADAQMGKDFCQSCGHGNPDSETRAVCGFQRLSQSPRFAGLPPRSEPAASPGAIRRGAPDWRSRPCRHHPCGRN